MQRSTWFLSRVSGGGLLWRSLFLAAFLCTQCTLGFQPPLLVEPSDRRRLERTASSSSPVVSTSITRKCNGNVQIHEDYVTLPNGITMQVLVSIPPTVKPNPELVLFLHGSFHAAWCWEEYYMPYFSEEMAGYIAIAPSWRGTGGTPCIVSEKKIPIHEHVEDLHHLLECIPALVQNHLPNDGTISWRVTNATPIHVVCHSFGGIVLMKYLEQYYNNNTTRPFRSIAMVCSVPPSGNGRMTMRYLRRSWRDSWKITRGFAMQQCCTDAALCRELFFQMPSDVPNGISDEDLARYQSHFYRDSRVVIDLMDLATKLPSQQTTPQGEARFVATFPPCLVLGAQHDFLVDREGLEETARYFGCYQDDQENDSDRLFHDRRSSDSTERAPKVVLVDSPHDVMLGATWINGAQLLLRWLQENAGATTTN